jgi:hypothetical protein
MRMKFVQGREVLDPVTPDPNAVMVSTETVFGLTPEELNQLTKIIYESLESSESATEFITKVVNLSSSGNAGWNFIVGFACGKTIEGMNTAASQWNDNGDARIRSPSWIQGWGFTGDKQFASVEMRV